MTPGCPSARADALGSAPALRRGDAAGPVPAMVTAMGLGSRLRALELATRPEHPDLELALARRWAELPAHARTRNQMLGRRLAGCEGTHGVFPRCDLACTPCYHSREANRVRVDGGHTVAEVDRQMALLRQLRGPGQNAQLIGGEVTLLDADDHAAALQAMLRHGRKPMSMSHGDFDYDYLERLALDPGTGRPRFGHLSFAGHFDSMMYGRRGIRRVGSESELDEYRARFCAIFDRLQREHGITHYLAHNMTVTPRNLEQIAGVIARCRDMGFRRFSFQPAAFVGNPNRWKDEYRAFTTDAVWAEVERGAGARLHWRALQIGDHRCNRTAYGAYGAYAGERYVPLLDEDDPRDARVLDDFIAAFGGMDFSAPPAILAARLGRGFAPPAAGGRVRPGMGAPGLRACRRPRRRARHAASGGDVRHARVHGRARRPAGLGGARARRGRRRSRGARGAGALAGVLLRDGPSRGRPARAGLRAACGARPGRERPAGRAPAPAPPAPGVES